MMMMKNSNYLYIMLAALTVSSCSDQSTEDVTSKAPILFSAGMDAAGASVSSRAGETYIAFNKEISAYLQVVGSWKNSSGTTSTITKTSKGVTGVASGTTNPLTLDPLLYWDDYGTADANNTEGRTAGLAIYAVASPGGGSIYKSPTDFTAVAINLPQDQSTTDWSTHDLVASNNYKGTSKYTFDGSALGKNPALLVFRHALSKITVNLLKGDGFTDAEVTTNLNATLTLLNLNYKGTDDIGTATITAGSAGNIIMRKASSNSTNLSTTPYATYNALVVPNSTTPQLDKTTDFLKIVVNGNTYTITAEQIVDALNKANSTSVSSANLESGKNYIFNVKVSKTKVLVTATVVDWTDVTGETVTPVIVTTDNRTNGTTGTLASPSHFWVWYTPYSSTAATNLTGYNGNTTMMATSPIYMTYASSTYKQYVDNTVATETQLYWPNHTVGYHLRGAVLNNATLTEPTVNTDATNGDYINLAYGSSADNDLLWGTHEAKDGTGALATRGNVALTFYHKMSEITVNLSTTTGTDKVILDDKTVVKLLGSKVSGKVLMGTGAISTSGDATDKVIDVVTAGSQYQTFVIPQSVTGLKFEVTVTNTDNTTDTYVIPLSDIKVGGSTITSLAEGTHYTYNLNIKKTGVTITASVVDWKNATGSTDVIL